MKSGHSFYSRAASFFLFVTLAVSAIGRAEESLRAVTFTKDIILSEGYSGEKTNEDKKQKKIFRARLLNEFPRYCSIFSWQSPNSKFYDEKTITLDNKRTYQVDGVTAAGYISILASDGLKIFAGCINREHSEYYSYQLVLRYLKNNGVEFKTNAFEAPEYLGAKLKLNSAIKPIHLYKDLYIIDSKNSLCQIQLRTSEDLSGLDFTFERIGYGLEFSYQHNLGQRRKISLSCSRVFFDIEKVKSELEKLGATLSLPANAP